MSYRTYRSNQPVSYTHLDVYKRQDNKSLIPSSRMRKKHKLYSTRIDAALVKNMKGKFDIKMNTACYENECKSKQAMDDVKRKNLPGPYTYSSWTRNVMRRRRRRKSTGRLKHIISATSTERRVQTLEVRILKNIENKVLLREHAGSKMTVEERGRKQVWKRRQKQFGVCLPRESCWKGRYDIFSTHPHRERKRHVINPGGVKCSTHCTSITGTTHSLLSKGVTQTSRSAPSLFTNKMRALVTAKKLTGHATMSPQIES